MYYLEYKKDLKKITKNVLLVVIGDDDEECYQVWSLGSDNEKIRNPTHGEILGVHEPKVKSMKNLMVCLVLK